MKNEITILLATYNGAEYLREQLDSIVSQTYQNYICYIHDDGSSDNTVKIIEDYVRKYPNKFERLEYELQGSAQSNFYSMLNFVHTPYVMFCDQDDVWKANKVEAEYLAMQEFEAGDTETPTLIYTDLEVVDKDLVVINKSFYKYMKIDPNNICVKSLLLGGIAPGCTLLVNYKLAEIMRNSSHGNMMHDSWAMLLASALGKAKLLNQSTLFYRQHEKNSIGARKKYRLKVIDKIFNRGLSIPLVYIRNIRENAQCLLKELPIDNENFAFVDKLAKIERKNKFERICFYWKYDFFNKNSSKLWLTLWL